MVNDELDIKVSDWQKEILTQDLKELEEDLLIENETNNFSWEEIRKEIRLQYGY